MWGGEKLPGAGSRHSRRTEIGGGGRGGSRRRFLRVSAVKGPSRERAAGLDKHEGSGKGIPKRKYISEGLCAPQVGRGRWCRREGSVPESCSGVGGRTGVQDPPTGATCRRRAPCLESALEFGAPPEFSRPLSGDRRPALMQMAPRTER